MNLAEIRKKAGAVKREESDSVRPAEAAVAAEPSELIEFELTPANMADLQDEESFFAAVMPEDEPVPGITADDSFADCEMITDMDFALPDEPVAPVQPDFQVEQPAPEVVPKSLDELPVIAAMQEAPAKSFKISPLDAIMSGREASAESDELLSTRINQESTDIEEYLCFRVADEEYAISIMAIKEIIKPREVTEVPRVQQFIQGVISLRGLIVPVMDMRCRLMLPVGTGTGRERIIVIRLQAGFCGILVDEVVQVARISKMNIEDPPAVLDGIDKAFVKGLGHFDGRMIILLDLETILDAGVH